jgi:hypothetical protein
MRQAVSDAAVKAVTATIRGATPLCSRGRTTTRIPAGEGLGAGLRRFRFRRWFTRLRLRLGVRGRAAAAPTYSAARRGLPLCCFVCGGRRRAERCTGARLSACPRPPLRLRMCHGRIARCLLAFCVLCTCCMAASCTPRAGRPAAFGAHTRTRAHACGGACLAGMHALRSCVVAAAFRCDARRDRTRGAPLHCCHRVAGLCAEA